MWINSEESGRQYIYCSKNATSDVAANNFFGKATAWVTGSGVYIIGDRVTNGGMQYVCISAITNSAVVPASDASHWSFDFTNYQSYQTAKSYNVGNKTTINNLHYTCIASTTGTFDVSKWTQDIISNKNYPYKTMNAAVTLLNGDGRFVSYESLDLVNNIATHNIHVILGNGIWSETMPALSKYIKVIGQSKWKTTWTNVANMTSFTYYFFKNLRLNHYSSVLLYVLCFRRI